MISFYVTGILLLIVLVYGLLEYQIHQRYVKSIPIRIHVNGTRGKSSVTRLIGAGLRSGGIKTFTKVTGTFPRLIFPDGSEAAIHRKEKANILEQLDIIKYCAKNNAEVLIIECMALQPQFQRITELQMVKSTIGVITNIRLDHLDVMGPGLEDVGKALSGTIPAKSKLFTSEERCIDILGKVSTKRKTEIHQSLAKQISDEDMIGFTYIEHKDNVALALDICLSLGMDREKALAEMKKTIPDEGVLTKAVIQIDNKVIDFYNAFAANDPESSLMIWNSIVSTYDSNTCFIILLNTRKDRQDRARQLIELIATGIQAHKVALIGESVELVCEMAQKNKIPENKIIAIGSKPTNEVYAALCNCSEAKTVIVGIGNMGAGGAELVKYFESESKI
ncbi:MAG: poly-gamma-glutamate synthase PgsB [Flavobacteriia bacterium]|nr:poly-gamma-glutamate synthase PgsB [Flavobacteriia bacterium]